MCFVFGAAKVNHAVEAGEGRASTLIPMRVELLLREDVATVLEIANTSCQYHFIVVTNGGVAVGDRAINNLPRRRMTP